MKWRKRRLWPAMSSASHAERCAAGVRGHLALLAALPTASPPIRRTVPPHRQAMTAMPPSRTAWLRIVVFLDPCFLFCAHLFFRIFCELKPPIKFLAVGWVQAAGYVPTVPHAAAQCPPDVELQERASMCPECCERREGRPASAPPVRGVGPACIGSGALACLRLLDRCDGFSEQAAQQTAQQLFG